jgi:hypothetical protein
MELLIAFLIAFGVVNTTQTTKMTANDANQLIKQNNLEKQYIIWEAEADDF